MSRLSTLPIHGCILRHRALCPFRAAPPSPIVSINVVSLSTIPNFSPPPVVVLPRQFRRNHGRPRIDSAQQIPSPKASDQCAQTHLRPSTPQHPISRSSSGCHPRWSTACSPERGHLRPREASLFDPIQCSPRVRCDRASSASTAYASTWWIWRAGSSSGSSEATVAARWRVNLTQGGFKCTAGSQSASGTMCVSRICRGPSRKSPHADRCSPLFQMSPIFSPMHPRKRFRNIRRACAK